MVNTTRRSTTGEPARRFSREELQNVITAWDLGLLHANHNRGFARLEEDLLADSMRDDLREDRERGEYDQKNTMDAFE